MNPNMAVAYDQYAFVLSCLGRSDEAIAMSKRAVKLEPLSSLMTCDFGWWLFLARRYDEAVVQFHNALALDPNTGFAYFSLGWWSIATGDRAGAAAAFEKQRTLDDPQPLLYSSLGYVYGVSGDRARAEQVLRDLEDLATQRYVSPGARVWVYLGLGDKEKTFEWLQKSYDEQDWVCAWLKTGPMFDDLRHEPRFQALLEKVGLEH